ncbi:hypothetical protein CPB83DRAFT_878598 [Crepidotus variabilis]|uniref:Uncharacterized protein n=1 Tax=Crepidotus variabilis TaxID=179855 RepID=A0A9P6JVG6_9AGAR|nr:hypothetical protein CPB83DRAFT_878598 [Crepidotus variabilis]
MPSRLFILPSFVLSLVYLGQVAAFTYNFNPPSECDDLGLTWSGGSPPFKLNIIPVFGSVTEISIPGSAFKDGKGSYSTPMTLPKGQKVVLSMSDSTGFNSGGVTDTLTVAASKGGSCNSTMPAAGFFFQLNAALQQCRPFTFDGYTGAAQPVTINAVIPGGTGIELNPPSGPTSFQWTANVAQGTSMIFFMTDAQGRSGGSSDIKLVGNSDDKSCLSNQSPSSTTHPPGSVATGNPSSSNSSQSSSTPKSSGVSGGAVAGGIIAGILFLAVVVTLIFFFLKKRRNEQAGLMGRSQRQKFEEIDGPDVSTQTPYRTNAGTAPVPYPYTPNTAHSPFLDNPPHNPGVNQLPAAGAYQAPPNTQNTTSGQYGQPGHQFTQSENQLLPPTGLYPYQPPTPHYQANVPQYPPTGYQNAPSQYRHQLGNSQDQSNERPASRYQASESAGSSSQNESTLPYLRNSARPPSSLYPPNSSHYGGVSAASDPFRTNPPSQTSSGEYDPYATQSQVSGRQESAAQRKAAMAGGSQQQGTSRFILHTDAEDAYPPPIDEEVVELPPQYTERRAGPVRLDPPSGLPAGTPYKS